MRILASYGALIAGAILAIAGVVILLTQRASTEFSAYGPVEATGPAGKEPGVAEADPTLGIAFLAVGLVAVVGWVVIRLVRRRAVTSRA